MGIHLPGDSLGFNVSNTGKIKNIQDLKTNAQQECFWTSRQAQNKNQKGGNRVSQIHNRVYLDLSVCLSDIYTLSRL